VNRSVVDFLSKDWASERRSAYLPALVLAFEHHQPQRSQSSQFLRIFLSTPFTSHIDAIHVTIRQSMREPYPKPKFGEIKRVDTSIPLDADENGVYL